MTNNLKTIRLNLYKLFWKYPYLKNKNYNYLYFKYVNEFSRKMYVLCDDITWNPEFWEKMPAMESISRCKRKLAKTDDLFRADSKKVIESRLKQTKE